MCGTGQRFDLGVVDRQRPLAHVFDLGIDDRDDAKAPLEDHFVEILEQLLDALERDLVAGHDERRTPRLGLDHDLHGLLAGLRRGREDAL